MTPFCVILLMVLMMVIITKCIMIVWQFVFAKQLSHNVAFCVEPCHGVLINRLMYDLFSICCIVESLLAIKDLIIIDSFLGATKVPKYLVEMAILTLAFFSQWSLVRVWREILL